MTWTAIYWMICPAPHLYAGVHMLFSIHRVTVWLASDGTHPVFWTVAGSLVKIPSAGIWGWVSWASLQMTGYVNSRTVGHYIFHRADQEPKHRSAGRHKHEGVTEEHQVSSSILSRRPPHPLLGSKRKPYSLIVNIHFLQQKPLRYLQFIWSFEPIPLACWGIVRVT